MPLSTTGATVPRPPRPPEPLWGNIPKPLIAEPRWVLWQYQLVKGKYTKIPLQPDGNAASSTDPGTWASFDLVQSAYFAGGFDGVGFVLNGDGLVGLDFDHCITESGEIDPTVRSYIERLDSYAELSPSGTGLRVFVYGKLPGPHRKLGPCEIYETARYLTITGMTLCH